MSGVGLEFWWRITIFYAGPHHAFLRFKREKKRRGGTSNQIAVHPLTPIVVERTRSRYSKMDIVIGCKEENVEPRQEEAEVMSL